ncbi:MAG: hypothetical protein IT466_09725 [Moraxellaceae bacterium]|nr:hypothetical protein [Moraxellaceae bacterium]
MGFYIRTMMAVLFAAGSAHVWAGDKGVGQTFYTQHSFYYEKGRYITTNYARGGVVPINSMVKIVDIGRKSIELELKGGTPVDVVNVVNVKKYTQKDIKDIQALLLGERPVSLDGYNEEIQKAIKDGVLKVGMKKSAVLFARGYPPAHATPSLDSDKWIYWQSRYNRVELIFDNDRIIQIRE